jgi:hypothetical protein
LINPPTCGIKTISSTLDSWSESTVDVAADSSYQVTQGAGGGSCVTDTVSRSFAPRLTGGMTDTTAGAYSPLVLRLTRNDGEQELTRIVADMPKGLVGKLAGVAQCPDNVLAAIPTAPGTGAAEKASPSCPLASRIGHLNVGSGAGPLPFYVPGTLYFAGPYQGAPFSIAAVTPAVAGGIDLGNVVIRTALYVDPRDSHVHVVSDPIPTILHGVQIHVRDSCEPTILTALINGAGGDLVSPTDDTSFSIDDPFQVGDCSKLAFKPVFKASTSAKTSRKNGASLRVTLAYPSAPVGTQANIKSVHVELPKALPSRLTTLQKACTDTVFNQNPANCPSGSRVGTAKASTPILSLPLEGPAYFVSHGGQKFPELIVVLQGEGVTVDLRGETFISKSGITSSTFSQVPDVPVNTFELTLPQGPGSALAAPLNLCETNLTMPTTFTAQNNATLRQNTRIEAQGCPYTLRMIRHTVSKRTLTLTVSVPQAGKLVATANGLTAAAKSATGRQTVTLKLKARSSNRLRARVQLRFTPGAGKQRTILRKTLNVTIG